MNVATFRPHSGKPKALNVTSSALGITVTMLGSFNATGARKLVNTESVADEQWVEQQFNAIATADEGYTDAQFMADVQKARAPLQDRAARARVQMKDGTAKKYPR